MVGYSLLQPLLFHVSSPWGGLCFGKKIFELRKYVCIKGELQESCENKFLFEYKVFHFLFFPFATKIFKCSNNMKKCRKRIFRFFCFASKGYVYIWNSYYPRGCAQCEHGGYVTGALYVIHIAVSLSRLERQLDLSTITRFGSIC